MQLTMYSASVPIFVQFLTSLSGALTKASMHCEARKIDSMLFLQTRLYHDMYPLGRQIREATIHATSPCSLLTGTQFPTPSDEDANFADAQRRITKAIDFINSIKPEQIDGTEDKPVTYTTPRGTVF